MSDVDITVLVVFMLVAYFFGLRGLIRSTRREHREFLRDNAAQAEDPEAEMLKKSRRPTRPVKIKLPRAWRVK